MPGQSVDAAARSSSSQDFLLLANDSSQSYHYENLMTSGRAVGRTIGRTDNRISLAHPAV
jgi:hypothetical protein